VIIGAGGSTLLFEAFAALLNEGDEVLAFDPSFPWYNSISLI
jgi:aspartate/methionine/tyrosine aminotransferase